MLFQRRQKPKLYHCHYLNWRKSNATTMYPSCLVASAFYWPPSLWSVKNIFLLLVQGFFFKKKRKKKQLGKSSPTFLSAGPISPTRLQLAARFTEGRSPAVHCWVFVGSEWHSARPWFILFLSSVWTKLYSSI